MNERTWVVELSSEKVEVVMKMERKKEGRKERENPSAG